MPKVTQHTSSTAGIRTQACLTVRPSHLTWSSVTLALTLPVQPKPARFRKTHLRYQIQGVNFSLASSQIVYGGHSLLAKCSKAKINSSHEFL